MMTPHPQMMKFVVDLRFLTLLKSSTDLPKGVVVLNFGIRLNSWILNYDAAQVQVQLSLMCNSV